MLVYCDTCEARVDAVHVGEYHRDEDCDEYWIKLSKCPACQSPIVTEQIEIGVDQYQDAILDDPTRLYPVSAGGLSPTIPSPVRAAFDEARRCQRSGAYTATAIMCRKALEGICVSHGITKGSLQQRLLELKNRGEIDPRLYEWADELRGLGNEAAHDVNVTVGSADAKDIIEFTVALLEYIFAFRERFQRFKQRRNASGPNTTTPTTTLSNTAAPEDT